MESALYLQSIVSDQTLHLCIIRVSSLTLYQDFLDQWLENHLGLVGPQSLVPMTGPPYLLLRYRSLLLLCADVCLISAVMPSYCTWNTPARWHVWRLVILASPNDFLVSAWTFIRLAVMLYRRSTIAKRRLLSLLYRPNVVSELEEIARLPCAWSDQW